MCGRFEIHSLMEIIATIFHITGGNIRLVITPNYNIAPTNEIPIVIQNKERQIVSARWGFVPLGCSDLSIGYKMINARAETVAEKPSFRQALRNHRCLVIADGFYEWKQQGKVRQPVYIRQKSHQPFGFAGIYNVRTSLEGEKIRTCSIITTEANELVRQVHDRMPVITPQDKYDLWLDPGVHDPEVLLPILKPCDPDALELYEVSSAVNSPRNNSPDNLNKIND